MGFYSMAMATAVPLPAEHCPIFLTLSRMADSSGTSPMPNGLLEEWLSHH
jgi:hypothetical protein